MTSHVVVAIPTAFSAEHAYRPVSDGLTGLILISITSLEERKKTSLYAVFFLLQRIIRQNLYAYAIDVCENGSIF